MSPVDPNTWRRSHKIAFRALCGAVIFFDLAFAIMVVFEPYETPKYVYIQAAIFSTLEACYIALALTLIVMHKFSTSHRDLGVALLYLSSSSSFFSSSCISSISRRFEMGKDLRQKKGSRYDEALHRPGDRPVQRSTSSAKIIVVPIVCILSTLGLAVIVGWVQGQSSSLLPRYMLGPAIIGAVCAFMSALASAFGLYLLKKGDKFHDKAEDEHERQHRNMEKKRSDRVPLDPHELKHKSHPFWRWNWGLYIAATAMIVFVGAYLYMTLCLILGSDEYCIIFLPGTTSDDCKVKGNNGAVIIVLLLVLLGTTGALLFYYREIVQDNLDYFDYRHERLLKLYDNNYLPRTKSSATARRSSTKTRGSDLSDQPPGYEVASGSQQGGRRQAPSDSSDSDEEETTDDDGRKQSSNGFRW
ncbi:hypothetical protein JCM5350_001074 [Sporobolomyces pararoseus]